MRFIERVLPDASVRAYVQEYMGYTLIADARFQRAQIWLGNGANGKGVLANILQALHAKTASVYLDELDGFKLAPLVNASLIYCDEAPERKLKQNRLKSLIAGETVSIDQKFKDIISRGITAKWLILSNHIPAVSDHSEGFWRRFDIVTFPVHIPEGERDPMLAKDIIRDELGGVLNWVLEGLVRLLARGQFDPKLPEPMYRAKLAARIATNSVAAWADDAAVVRTTVVETPRTMAYRHYKEWCRENGVVAESSIQFWRSLDIAIGPLMDSRAKTSGGYVRTSNVRLNA
jgi:putative DNA primase/helicase